jgi:hypothetical protein
MTSQPEEHSLKSGEYSWPWGGEHSWPRVGNSHGPDWGILVALIQIMWGIVVAPDSQLSVLRRDIHQNKD